jgi:hypothetical protein
MITIQLPNIAVQKVTNGYVVQWQKANPDEKQSQRTITASSVCLDKEALLIAIDKAADDIAAIGG